MNAQNYYHEYHDWYTSATCKLAHTNIYLCVLAQINIKPDTSNSHEFELHRPSNKGTKLLLKVIKAIIIITGGQYRRDPRAGYTSWRYIFGLAALWSCWRRYHWHQKFAAWLHSRSGLCPQAASEWHRNFPDWASCWGTGLCVLRCLAQ